LLAAGSLQFEIGRLNRRISLAYPTAFISRQPGAIRRPDDVVIHDHDLHSPYPAAVSPLRKQGPSSLPSQSPLLRLLRPCLSSGLTVAGYRGNRILPVRSSCIMPCLTWRALASFASSPAISASMSERIAARASCSAFVGGKQMGSSSSFFRWIPFA